MAIYSSILAWKIPRIEEPGGLQSMGLQRVGTPLKRLSMPAQNTSRPFLVAQWRSICLAMQGTWVQFLAQEDPTCRGATEPMYRNY